MMRFKHYPLIYLLMAILLLTIQSPAHAQTPPNAVTTPNFNTLAPCPTCTSPSYPVISGGASPAVSTSQQYPGSSMAPCESDASYSDNHKKKKSKHKKHSGALSKSMEKLIEFLIELLNMLLKLLGGGQINMPSSGEPVPSTAAPLPSGYETPVISSGNTDPQPSMPQTNPCPPQSSQPSTPVSGPSSALPSGSAQPAPSGTQTAAACGAPAPAPGPNAVLTTTDSNAALNISSGGTAGAPKIYDGGCHTVGTITIKADNVVVQNFKVVATGQYGISSEGTNITIQNNDIKNVHASGDGDLNAITFFGNDTKILYNTAIDFVTGDPGSSHTDAIQTWVSSSHPTASTNVVIKGNKFTGPANPSRANNIPSIHQCIMAEGLGRGGNSGGSGDPSNWLIADNFFSDSWNQCIKLDGIDKVSITRNEFAGSSDNVAEITEASAEVKFYDDNKITGSYSKKPTTVPGPGPTSL